MASMTCMRTPDCWCRECHVLRLDQYDNDNLERLQNQFIVASNREEHALQAVFKEVMNSAAIAKVFRLKLERLSGYKYVKPYLKQVGYEKENAEKLSKSINEACWVYDNLQRILNNLLQFDSINVRRLSMRQLYLAKDLHWCLRYVQDHKVQGSKPQEPIYDEEDFKALEDSIRNSNAYGSLEKNPKLITAMLLRLQKNLVKNP